MSAVTKTIKKAGFSVAVETGADLDAYCDWHLTVGDHTAKSRFGKMEGLDCEELTAKLLGDCQCSGAPCPCSMGAHGVVGGLLPVILRNAQLVVENALEQGEYAVEDASRGFLRGHDEED